jgi:hypothetical protein
MPSVDDKCAIRERRHGGRQKGAEYLHLFVVLVRQNGSEVKYGSTKG